MQTKSDEESETEDSECGLVVEGVGESEKDMTAPEWAGQSK